MFSVSVWWEIEIARLSVLANCAKNPSSQSEIGPGRMWMAIRKQNKHKQHLLLILGQQHHICILKMIWYIYCHLSRSISAEFNQILFFKF